MINQLEWADIDRLLKAGFSVPETACRIGRSVATVYRLKAAGGPKLISREETKIPKRLLKFQPYLENRIRVGVTNATKIHLELQTQGYKGPYYLVNRFVRQAVAKRLHRSRKPSIRFETEPGLQAQADWGHVGKIEIAGREHKLYCFVYILSYSRMKFVEFAVRQNLQTLEECHIRAFEKLGIPKEIVYDNMKTVVLGREKLPDKTKKIHFHPGFQDFARYYGFALNPHWPYHPQSKGKIEKGVGYVKNHFMQGMKPKRDFKSLEELNEKVNVWLKDVANAKIHGTTRKIPLERYAIERFSLKFPNGLPKFITAPLETRKVSASGTISYKNCLYSAPIEFAKKTVSLREINEGGIVTLEVFYSGRIITTHILSSEPWKFISKDEHFIPKRKEVKRSKNRKRSKRPVKAENNSTIIAARPLSYYNQIIPNLK